MNNFRFRNILLINALLWLSVFVICLFIRPIFTDMTISYLMFCAGPLALTLLLLLMWKINTSDPPEYFRLIIISLNVLLAIFLMWVSKPLWKFYSLLNFTFFMIIFYFITYYYRLRFREVLVFGTVFQISLLLYLPIFANFALILVNSLTIMYYTLQNTIFFIYFVLIASMVYFSHKESVKKTNPDNRNISKIQDRQEKSVPNFYTKVIDIYFSERESGNRDSLHNKIKQILEVTGKYCHADRAYIFEIDTHGTYMDNTIEWCIDPAISQQKYLQKNPVSDYPWWMNKLYNNEYVFIESVQALPAEAIHEKEMLAKQGIFSLIVIGLYSKKKLSGFIGMDFVNPATNRAKLEYVRFLSIAGLFINDLLKHKQNIITFLLPMNSQYSGLITSDIFLQNMDRVLNDIPCILISRSLELTGINIKGKNLFNLTDSQIETPEYSILNSMQDPEKSKFTNSLKRAIESDYPQGILPDFIFEKNKNYYSVYYSKIYYQDERFLILLTFYDMTLRYTIRMDLIKEVEEKKRMLSEIHHRVKNNMQIISNFMDLENLKINHENALSIFNDTRDRIKGLAILHEKLYESREFGRTNLCIYLKELAENIILVLSNHKNIKFEYSGHDEIIASFDTAVTCGLLVNEITVNSLRHAFPDIDEGRISLNISKDRDEIVIIIGDNGSGFEKKDIKDNKSTLGLRLIDGFVRELNGTYELSSDQGTGFIIRFRDTYSVE